MRGHTIPTNLLTLEPYSGKNLLILMSSDYDSPYWLTFVQAMKAGCPVKKGEKGTHLVRVIDGTRTDPTTGEKKRAHGLKGFCVFNSEQLTQNEHLDALLANAAAQPGQKPLPPKPVPTHPVPVSAPPSIQHFIKSQGGIDPSYNHGQWAHELKMIREAGNGLVPGLLNRNAGKTMEEMANACHAAGYILDSDVDEMLFALSKDVEACTTGDKLGRVYGHGDESYVVALAEARYDEQFAD